MGRLRDTSNEENGSEESIDISPLIDVVFILLIFFIVTTTIIQESGLEVDRPQSTPREPQEENETIVLSVTEGGEVLFEGQNIGVSGIQPLVKRRLREQEVPVIVQVDDLALTDLMVRVIDEAKLAGAEKVSLGKL